jgi:hypothetical protein
VAAQLAASEEGLISMELVSYLSYIFVLFSLTLYLFYCFKSEFGTCSC